MCRDCEIQLKTGQQTSHINNFAPYWHKRIIRYKLHQISNAYIMLRINLIYRRDYNGMGLEVLLYHGLQKHFCYDDFFRIICISRQS